MTEQKDIGSVILYIISERYKIDPAYRSFFHSHV